MKWFNIIAGISSIISLFISCFVADKVIKISKKLKIDSSTNVGKQTAIGKDNNISGRDMK
ncbi:MAG: hypothetical protein FXF47_07720 [Candidatus Mcinerneyibacterium aminivorans]|uniref:Lipoprotein n=1 Tax=Candidatus Mcinerneyibacterium aminivorans TaxID=2703815 RepID=A0A5D0MJJ4_9BACT|nr:MAG: hypothetical protein FXF47_07720 [Candidatus Mcinerneyibacterium aminivorans]